MKIIVVALSLVTFNVHAVEQFNVETPLSIREPIQPSIVVDLSRDIDLRGSGCSESSIREAIEATRVHLSSTRQEILVKPTAWCLCGAYYCPVWIYQLVDGNAKRIWFTPGTASVEILSKKQNGYHHIRESGGTAGHSYFRVWSWNGTKYRVSREKYTVAGNEKK
jgi:hypothetical protein